jgi:diguanylate cyclase (GGDEF)-like protein
MVVSDMAGAGRAAATGAAGYGDDMVDVTESALAAPAGTNRAGTDRAGTDRAGTDRAGTDRVRAAEGSSRAVADVLRLATQLRDAPSGMAFVYDVLDYVAARFDLRDAVVVVADVPVGRQVFRLRRRSPRAGRADPAGRWLARVMDAPPGLYGDPAVIDPDIGAAMAALATVAVRMDLLAHDARHDPLTGLLNRRSYDTALAGAVARSQRYGWPFALILIDVDNFKAVNDELGHAAGDDALRVLGSEVRAILRSGDVAARLGGDEFALLINNADSPAVLGPLAERLRSALDRAVPTARIRFSAGVACFPRDADDADRLQRIADQRLYADKATIA